MLIQFTVENHRSIKNSAVISFAASKLSLIHIYVNLDVKAGQVIAILGHNGSGKSTLAKHINALLTPTEGVIWVDGMDAGSYTHLDVYKRQDCRYLWNARASGNVNSGNGSTTDRNYR